MIRLPNIYPGKAVLEQLERWQSEVSGNAFYAQKELAEKLFNKFSNKRNSDKEVFVAIKQSLSEMCAGAQRCVYCEDSAGTQIDHVYPKSLYPELVFSWPNYVFACGDCNTKYKRGRFAVFVADEIDYHELPSAVFPKDNPMPAAPIAFIDPRNEDPMAFAVLDIANTFKFTPMPQLSTVGERKFRYTYEVVLKLNGAERELLREAREEAFGDFKARFIEYDRQKKSGASQDKLDKLVAGIQKKNHITVWREMQRWHINGWLLKAYPELAALFEEHPAALAW